MMNNNNSSSKNNNVPSKNNPPKPNGELLSISKWALKKLEEKYGRTEDNDSTNKNK